MMHSLAASPITSQSVSSALLWAERSARLLGVMLIIGMFLWKMGATGKHFLEIAVLLILGVWYVPAIVPPEASQVIASVNTGGSVGITGISLGMLALLVGLAAVVIYALR